MLITRLATKLHIAALRPQLIARLNEGLKRPVTLLSAPVLLSLQTVAGLKEKACEPLEASGRVRLAAHPGVVSLDRIAQQYARAAAGIGTDQLWAALRQRGAATLTGRDNRV